MKRTTIILFTLLFFASCDKENYTPKPVPDPKPEDTQTNTNANTIYNTAAQRLEMPHIDASMFFTAHYAIAGPRDVMNLALEWNSMMRHADWVAFSWDATTSRDSTNRNEAWKWDPSIPSSLNAVADKEHSGDGYDKGHLCASDDRAYTTEANQQTFYLSNISPQLSSFNQKFWARLEQRVQRWGKLTQRGILDTVYVAKGGTLNHRLKFFTGTKQGSDKVIPTTDAEGFTMKGLAVPEYYFMALLTVKDGKYNGIAFCVPHREDLPKSPTAEDFKKYIVSISQLEEFTNLDFFCNLPDKTEKEVEEKVDTMAWEW